MGLVFKLMHWPFANLIFLVACASGLVFVFLASRHMHFLKFANKEDERLCASIRDQNGLIIDDVTTSGSTLNEMLRTLRILNEDNNIVVFSLIGRKDLMADVIV